MMDLKEIKAREQAATPGPWEVKTNRHPETTGEAWGWIKGPSENWCWTDRRSSSRHDAEFIAHARADIPTLLAEVERLMRRLQTLMGIEAQEHQQIATLKKALEMAQSDLNTLSEITGIRVKDITGHIRQAQEQEGHDGRFRA